MFNLRSLSLVVTRKARCKGTQGVSDSIPFLNYFSQPGTLSSFSLMKTMLPSTLLMISSNPVIHTFNMEGRDQTIPPLWTFSLRFGKIFRHLRQKHMIPHRNFFAPQQQNLWNAIKWLEAKDLGSKDLSSLLKARRNSMIWLSCIFADLVLAWHSSVANGPFGKRTLAWVSWWEALLVYTVAG